MSHNGSHRHPYLHPRFFFRPESMFWEVGNSHTEKSKAYFRLKNQEKMKALEKISK